MSDRITRLAGLAAAMKLPCPVRESFLFVADAAFVGQCVASNIELQRAAKRVFRHAGLSCDATVVLWRAGELASTARVERDEHTWFLELDPSFRNNGPALAQVLVRAAARAVLISRDVATTPTPIDVELAALLLGFGPVLVTQTAARNSLTIDTLRSLHTRICASLRVPLARTLDLPLASRGLRFQLALIWIIARVIMGRVPLVFAPIGPHVVIRCFCARRLRVPTGALGTTTCPACKRKRPFDGRACRTTTLAA